MSHHRVTAVTDNQQVYYMIRTGRSKNQTCMLWLKEMFWVCVEYDIDLLSEYIASEANVVADTLSRLCYVNTRKKVNDLLCGVDLCCKGALIKFCRSSAEAIRGEVQETSV